MKHSFKCIPDETLFQVFDIASQAIDNSWRNSKQKFAKFSVSQAFLLGMCDRARNHYCDAKSVKFSLTIVFSIRQSHSIH